jgi:hypothetical protein
MHHGMGTVDALELVVVPSGALRPLVLAVADLSRRALKRLHRARRVEVELDHLPVALVQVVPVVEDVEEPVLEGELARMPWIRRDIRIDGGRPARDEPPLPMEIRTARVERVPRKVEVVLVEALGEIVRRRADLDQVVAPRPAQGDRRLAEERVDVDRGVRLARRAVRVLDEPHDRGIAFGQRLRVGQACGGAGCRRASDRGKRDEQCRSRQHAVGCSQPLGPDTKRSIPRRRERTGATSWPLTLFPAGSRSGESPEWMKLHFWSGLAPGTRLVKRSFRDSPSGWSARRRSARPRSASERQARRIHAEPHFADIARSG